ncbi:MAG: large-conductance mechanosensitive ion channel [Thermoplasmatales archaeon I-plasma]|jgi:Large-conductance mechanosensitive channel|nr:MAG: large-conductance mechanosensitive ion channel [Thermoplasmatales archaeon I-plasma]
MTVDRTITNSVGSDSEMLDELRKIRALLEPKPAPPAPPPPKGFVKEFKMFLEQYKVMGMAVAFILGLYLGTLVQSLVTNLIMPIIDIVLPGIAWQNIHAGPFLIGSFLGALVTFLIIALVIFLLVKITSKLGIK